MKNNVVRIGSRGSELALWQSAWIREQLTSRFPHLTVSIITITTSGDQMPDSPLPFIGGKGIFTKEIEHALLLGTIDLAVHSLKDLPTTLPDGLAIGAVTEREDVRDVFIPRNTNPIATLTGQPPEAVVATGSLRRRSQLRHLHPRLSVIDLRGNLHTRFRKLDASDWAGMILAAAGVRRLGLDQRVGEYLPADRMLPAVGQGALAVELRSDDVELAGMVRSLNHGETEAATAAERSLLKELEGGCQIPIGAYARIEGGSVLKMDALVASLDGATIVRGSRGGDPSHAIEVGRKLAAELLSKGADRILGHIRASGVTGGEA